MNKHVVIVGGGLAGLAASIFLARGGRMVTVFEKRRALGGRAITHLRHGYRFNLGAHAFHRFGPGAAVLRELGIPVRGLAPRPRALALRNGEQRGLPLNVLSLLTTSLLPLGAKVQLARAFWRIRRIDRHPPGAVTVRQWIEANVEDPVAREVLEAVVRLATLSDHPETDSAALALPHVKAGLRGTLYVDEGWQRIVDSMQSTAISAGVNFVTSSRIVGVDCEGGRVRAIQIGGLELEADRMDTQAVALPEIRPDHVEGARVPAETVLLAVDPSTAAGLAGDAGASWESARPVTAACLDVALRSLPNPKATFAVGIEDPLYFGVHSAWAQLTPKGGVLIHTMKYRKEQTATDVEIDGERTRRDAVAAADERALESLLDRLQPGWREVLVHKRFLPSMTVSNAAVSPGSERPSPATPVQGLYLAGDWVGGEGLLSDASLSSARAAAKAILAS